MTQFDQELVEKLFPGEPYICTRRYPQHEQDVELCPECANPRRLHGLEDPVVTAMADAAEISLCLEQFASGNEEAFNEARPYFQRLWTFMAQEALRRSHQQITL